MNKITILLVLFCSACASESIVQSPDKVLIVQAPCNPNPDNFDKAGEVIAGSAFRVEYRANFKDGYDLVWEDDGWKTILSTKEDVNSFPVVVRDNDGTQDVLLLMEAMDKAEFLKQERIKLEEEFL